MIATEAEMMSAKLLPEERDFCAHKLLEHKACRADTWPWVYKCAPEKHEFLNCQYEEWERRWDLIEVILIHTFLWSFSYIIRMKEYERERRLMERQVRIAKKQQMAA